jgi:hypothetical protein
VNDAKNFGARITKIGVAVAKLWRKEVIGTYLQFLKVAIAISRIILKIRVVFLKICGPRLDFTEGQGANCKIGRDFLARIYFAKGKHGGLSPPFVDR